MATLVPKLSFGTRVAIGAYGLPAINDYYLDTELRLKQAKLMRETRMSLCIPLV